MKNTQFMNAKVMRALIVDDAVVYRKAITEIISQIPKVEVVGTAPNGKIAISKIKSLKPDILTLDIEMPEMDGIEVLEWIKNESPDTGVIVLSSYTTEGGALTMRALELGAFDFIPKPAEGSFTENIKKIKESLSSLLAAYKRSSEVKKRLGRKKIFRRIPNIAAPNLVLNKETFKIKQPIIKPSKSEIIAIGISTGGPNALTQLLPQLPCNIGVPILIVQHMPPVFTTSLANSLNMKSKIEVKEASNGEIILPNKAYIAPGGKQMKVSMGLNSKNRIIRITNDPPENSCKPSVDYLFNSIADHYMDRATGIIMTGMGSDGTLGIKNMKSKGATIIAQDQQSCVVYGMPKIAIENGLADIIVPLNRIADEILKIVYKK